MASFFAHIILSLSVLPLLLSIIAQINGTVTIGDSLDAKDNSSWPSSPSGDFSFGFRQIKTDPDLFLLCIWYSKISERTIVWYANGDLPAVKGSKLELTSDNGLVLTGPQKQDLWKSGTNNSTRRIARGFMNDTGNFVLEDGDSVLLWESFRNPSDTILPTQTLLRGDVLSSRKSETNFSRGKFQLRFQQDGSVDLTTINLPSTFSNQAYYSRGTADDSITSSPGEKLLFNVLGELYILRENGQQVNLRTRSQNISSDQFYFRTTLDFDGVLTIYYHPKNSDDNIGNWTAVWLQPDDICVDNLVYVGSGTCGYNSICTKNSDGRPNCSCPRGYSLLDPSDQFSNCKSNFTPSCGDSEMNPELYSFEELTNVDWPLSDYATYNDFSEEECKISCLEDCLCAVAVHRFGNTCWKKRIPLSNGKKDNNLLGKVLVKIKKDNVSTGSQDFPNSLPRGDQKKNQDTLIIAGSVLLGGSFFANLLLIGVICLGFVLIYKKKNESSYGSSGIETNIHFFSYKQLLEATDGFKEELGRGAFGIVYKGELRKGSGQFVAVKKLNTMIQDGEKEFRMEMNVIGQTHHKNTKISFDCLDFATKRPKDF